MGIRNQFLGYVKLLIGLPVLGIMVGLPVLGISSVLLVVVTAGLMKDHRGGPMTLGAMLWWYFLIADLLLLLPIFFSVWLLKLRRQTVAMIFVFLGLLMLAVTIYNHIYAPPFTDDVLAWGEYYRDC